MRTPHAIVAALVAMLSMGAPTAHAQQTVKIGTTPSFIFLPIYAAEQLGYFKAEGITAQFVDFEGGAEVTTAMVGGSIDLGGTMAERPLILAEKGFGAKNLVALENKNPLFLVLRKDHPAKSVKDLKGSKLGMTRAGSGTDLSLRALLKDAGLEADKDVAIIAVGGVSSANAALKAGQIDGFMGGEPAGAVAVEQLKLARYFLDPRVGQGPRFLQFMTFPTLQASDKWIAANPQTAEKLVRAMVRTLKRMREDPESAVSVGQKIFPALDVGIIRSIIAIEKNTYYPTITEEAMRTLNQFQKQTGAVKGDVAYDKVVATQYLRIWEQ
ncbi:MAG TPA: ABC transporter substrate-binding protein [Methylomirabilota bacterium]